MARERTTAGPSTPLRSAQDDTLLVRSGIWAKGWSLGASGEIRVPRLRLLRSGWHFWWKWDWWNGS